MEKDLKIEFKKGEKGGIIATFLVKGLETNYSVVARKAGKTIKFDLIDEIGTKRTLSEEQFKEAYPEETLEYEKELKEYEEKNKEEKNMVSISDTTNVSNDIKDERTYDIDGQIFCIRLLEDDLINNYAEVVFKKVEPVKNKETFYKALVIMDAENPTIAKINVFNEKGESLDPILPQMFKEQNPDMNSRLIRALKAMARKIDKSKRTM